MQHSKPKTYLFHEGDPYDIKISPWMICSTNHWTGFYIIETSVLKELNNAIFTERKYLDYQVCFIWYWLFSPFEIFIFIYMTLIKFNDYNVSFCCDFNLEWIKHSLSYIARRSTFTVYNFQSMKSTVEMDSLLLKFFYCITWFDERQYWMSCKRSPFFKSYCYILAV